LDSWQLFVIFGNDDAHAASVALPSKEEGPACGAYREWHGLYRATDYASEAGRRCLTTISSGGAGRQAYYHRNQQTSADTREWPVRHAQDGRPRGGEARRPPHDLVGGVGCSASTGAAMRLSWNAPRAGYLWPILLTMVANEASRIVCAVLDQLHAPRNRPLPELVPLTHWFEPLYQAADAHGAILRVSAAAASHLLKTQREIVGLHGDMHHGNVLNFGSRGWLAIDPKNLIGERYFDSTSFVTPMKRRRPHGAD
jgi:Aminoglycoside/hydroxyurea antibiotic resistance kinase